MEGSTTFINTFKDLTEAEMYRLLQGYIESGRAYRDEMTAIESEYHHAINNDEDLKALYKLIICTSNIIHGDTVIIPKNIHEKMMAHTKEGFGKFDPNELFQYAGVLAGLGVYVYANQKDNDITVLKPAKDFENTASVTFKIIP